MKKLATSLLFLISFGTFAQITIDSAHMPQNGDNLRYSIAPLDSAILLNYQKSDTNLTWNFDSLVPIRQGITAYVDPAETPYSTSISNRIGEKRADTFSLGGIDLMDVYDFYSNSSTEFAADHRAASVPTGLSFPFPATFSIAQSYADKDEIYQFPLNYGDRDSSTYEFTFNNLIPAAHYSSSGYRINEVDAWGTLTTPYGTFNCIRVVTDIVGYDTISYDTINFGISSHLREYKWLTTEFEIPALTINGTVINDSIFIPTTVQYRDSVRDVPALLAPIAIFVADTVTPQIGDTVSISNFSLSILPASYEWDISPNTFQYVNGTSTTTDSIVVVFNDTGFYDVQLIAINSNGRDTLLIENYILVDSLKTSLIELYNSDKSLKVFPNPINEANHFFIQIPSNIRVYNTQLYDIKGKLISRIQFNNGPTTYQKKQIIKISSPPKAGIYLIIVDTSEGLLSTKISVGK